VTAITVNSVLRSVLSLDGITAAMASAAEAPQIATAPPVSSANRHCRPNSGATTNPVPMVSATSAASNPAPNRPICARSSNAMRRPSRPTPSRSTVLAQNSTPARHGPLSCRKLNAIPSSSANSITGAP